jgi:hypothetical protein
MYFVLLFVARVQHMTEETSSVKLFSLKTPGISDYFGPRRSSSFSGYTGRMPPIVVAKEAA